MSLIDILIAYIIGFAVIVGLTLLTLRSEPTAHGQIVGRQVGCIVAVLWPIAIPWFIGLIVWQFLKRGERPW